MFDSIKTFAGDNRVQFFAMGFVAGATVLGVASLLARPKDLVEATVDTAAKAADDVATKAADVVDDVAEAAEDVAKKAADDSDAKKA